MQFYPLTHNTQSSSVQPHVQVERRASRGRSLEYLSTEYQKPQIRLGLDQRHMCTLVLVSGGTVMGE
jgi:hypothetical protein